MTQPLRPCCAVAVTVFASFCAAGATICVNPEGTSGCVNAIGAAVLMANPNDTIQVAPGVYKETVTITKPLSLLGANRNSVIINANGRANGIYIDGLDNAGLANVTISGFTVENANFEGILATNTTALLIKNNIVSGNDKGLNVSAATCAGQPAFETSEGDDCGEGIHLMGVDHSTVSGNQVQSNAGGILITDETAPNHDNLIIGNTVVDNPYDCGITLASHPQAMPLTAPQGVYHITVSGNTSMYNGVVNQSGAGVGIFTPSPGTANYGNLVINNELIGNGLPGVALHSHAPNQKLADNIIVGNHIANNGPDDSTTAPTGIAIMGLLEPAGTPLPVTGTVISGNVIEQESIDVAVASTAAATVQLNSLGGGAGVIGVQNLGTGTINATENWWGCANGPSDAACTTVNGTGISFAPWLSNAPGSGNSGPGIIPRGHD
ncbi:MAG TPA: NosD domain-containing protein [Bryobacteraceae bacterium]|nr:NosD domain-containing protein [Bryobacteraceae bacterium]